MELKNVTIRTQTEMVDILARDNQCDGVILRTPEEGLVPVFAQAVIWACGGIGGIYEHSTNFPHLTGDALAISLRRGIEVEHMDYVQIHPTTLYTCRPGRSFLISESVRGEGAVLYNKQGERFVDELLPRDVVTEAIHRQMAKDHMPYVRLSFLTIKDMDIRGRFPNIYERCLEEGYDITKEPIPVVPAQHYFMGGVWVDSDSRTSMEHLYAAGETSCNGVHGANRLASNSLLESLVFAERAAAHIQRHSLNGGNHLRASMDITKIKALYNIDMETYENPERYHLRCKENIWEEIRREAAHESNNNQIKCG